MLPVVMVRPPVPSWVNRMVRNWPSWALLSVIAVTLAVRVPKMWKLLALASKVGVAENDTLLLAVYARLVTPSVLDMATAPVKACVPATYGMVPASAEAADVPAPI